MHRILPLLLMLAACSTDAGGVNQPPTLSIDVTSEISATVGEDVVRVTLTAEDPEGGAVTLSMVNKPERAEFQANGSWGVFTWDPISSDVTPAGPLELVFVATDERGASTEKVVLVVVLAGNGVPRFVSSSSVLHNVGSGPVSFEVKVRDDDSNDVIIRMPEGFAPEGSDLTKTGEFTAQFGWQPTAEQVQQRIHTVKFVATDGVNDPVEQDVTIILKKDSSTNTTPDSSGCLFEDTVTYEPLKAQRNTSDYVISARLTGVGGYDRLTLNYTTGDAFNDYSADWKSVEMTPEGDRFVGVIPNPLGPEISEIYYELCAINDDPTEEENFPVLCGPSSLYDGFLAYPPSENECEDDSFSYVDDFESASDIPGDEWLYRRMCEGKDDFFEVGLGTNQEATIYFTFPTWANPTIEVYNIDGVLEETATNSTCGGFTDVFVANTGAPTKKYLKVIGNAEATDFSYQVTGSVVSTADPSTCIDAQYEPNEEASNATAVTSASAMFSGLEICRSDDVDVFSIQASVGQQIKVRAEFQSSIADIDLKLFSPTQEVGRSKSAVGYSLGIGDVEEITYVVKTSGTFHAMVYSVDNPNRYSFTVEVTEAPMTCTDTDSFEPNNTQATAKLFFEGTTDNLQSCGFENDWYSFYVFNSLDSYEVELTPDAGAFTMTYAVEFWNTFGKISEATLSAGKFKATLYPIGTGEYFIVVKPILDGTYSLKLTRFSTI
ncbi:MAG: hypothetical protein R3E66_17335 [bacterium]